MHKYNKNNFRDAFIESITDSDEEYARATDLIRAMFDYA